MRRAVARHVGGGTMCYALAFHHILLVREHKHDLGHTVNVVVIQRCDDGGVHTVAQSRHTSSLGAGSTHRRVCQRMRARRRLSLFTFGAVSRL